MEDGDRVLHELVHGLVRTALNVLPNQFVDFGPKADFHSTILPQLANTPDSAARPQRLNRLRKRSVLQLILGGAAVNRCDNWLLFRVGFSR